MDNKKINFSGDFEKDIVLTLQEIQKQENTQKVPIPKLHIIGFSLFSIVIFIGSYYFISLGGYPEKIWHLLLFLS